MQYQLLISQRSITTSITLAIISLICPGTGHMFAGRFRRGLILFSIIAIIELISAVTGIMNYFAGAAIVYTLVFLAWLVLVIDSYIVNRNKSGIILKWYNKWYLYVMMAASSFLLINFVSVSWGYSHMSVVSNVNAPFIQKGDNVLTHLNYGYSSGLHILPDTYQPYYVVRKLKYSVGSYVIFYFQDDIKHENIYLRRIVADSNDTLAIKNGQVYLNGKINNELRHFFNQYPINISENWGPISVPSDSVLLFLNDENIQNPGPNFTIMPKVNIQGHVILILWANDKSRLGRIKVD
jgi:signal peptidase I